ncbi:MAG: guanylate kinase [Eubacterium sp.]|nr:guanylate kinase [Eubacterium sp.]
MGKIFYLIGKSATGKDHIYEKLLQDTDLRLFPIVLYTTRPMRSGEEDGREYHFVSVDQMEEMRKNGQIIEQRVYDTVMGPWYYFTSDTEINPEEKNYIGIGTPESFLPLSAHFGQDVVVPLYVETEDGIRLGRAVDRERKQQTPRYDEVCRRFLADMEDFSEEKLKEAGITKRFANNGTLQSCISEIKTFIGRYMQNRDTEEGLFTEKQDAGCGGSR